jgi:5-methylcytosine-specific restriction protein A
MSAYLVTWNPSLYAWSNLPNLVKQIKKNGSALNDWTCGTTKRIAVGDYVFMLRQGKEPKGIIGFGRVLKGSYPSTFKNRLDGKTGHPAQAVDVEWKVLSETPLISRMRLYHPKLVCMNWDTQSSGISIPATVAEVLLEMMDLI